MSRICIGYNVIRDIVGFVHQSAPHILDKNVRTINDIYKYNAIHMLLRFWVGCSVNYRDDTRCDPGHVIS